MDKTKENSIKKESKKNIIIQALDENNNGVIDVEDIILKCIKIPGIKINRAEFLKKQLLKSYPEEIIEKAIAESPMKANIPLKEIDKLANDVIDFERTCVTGISTALGVPGGWAMVATIPADILQYYGYLLRAAQKLLYLYGFPQIDLENSGSTLDDNTLNVLIICLGVMLGVAGSNQAIKIFAQYISEAVEKCLEEVGEKVIINPLLNLLSKYISKNVLKNFFRKAIPFIGAIIGGAITFLSFKPCCKSLQKTLQNTILSNPKYKVILESEFQEIAENFEEDLLQDNQESIEVLQEKQDSPQE